MICRVVFVILLGMMPHSFRGQCLDGLATARQIRAIKNAAIEQWVPQGLLLKKQLEDCRAVRDSNYAEVLFILGYGYSLTGENKRAIGLTRASIVINQPKNSLAAPARRVQAYYYLGNYLRADNQLVAAFNAYQQCINLGHHRSDAAPNIIRSLIGQSQIAHLQGDYEQALNKVRVSYHKAILWQDKLLQAECLLEIARNSISLGQLEEAGNAARQAIRSAHTDPYGGFVENISREMLATTLRNQNRPAEALREYRKLASIYHKTGAPEQAAHIYNSMGNLYGKNPASYQKALFFFAKAYADFHDVLNKAVSLNNIGDIHRDNKQYAQAFNYFQRALNVLPIGFTGKKFVQNPPAQAIQLVAHEEILLSIMQDKADTWLAYGKATHNRQRLRYALDTYRVVDEMIDIMRWQHVGQRSKLFWREKTRSTYERAIETCYRLGDTGQAFRFFEKSRAVMLTDKLNELGGRHLLSPAQVAHEQRLRQRIGERQRELGRVATDSAHYQSAQQAFTVSQDSLNEFLKQIEVTNRAYYRTVYDSSVTSTANLKGYLRRQQAAFVTYFEGDSARYVLSITPDTSSLLRQPKGTYRADVKSFMDLLADPDALNRRADLARFLRLGHRLYGQNLAPLRLPAGRVIISPDGLFVPFETFSRSADKPDYLVRDYAFSYAYSARFLLRREEDATAGLAKGGFLGVAPVTFAPALHQLRLGGSDRALSTIADHFDVKNLLTNQAATRRAFLAQATNACIIHLFTHALADSSDREPRLFLADSSLSLSDLGAGALPNAQLVVLAACQTGVGTNQRGEGVFSLARGFAALGVPSILTTLWNVDNEATYKLTNLFYKYLADDLPKDIALQRAQREWLDTADGASQSPTYWAGLILVGDAQPLSHDNRWRWLCGLLLVGVAGLGWWRWKRPTRRSADAVSRPV